VELDGFFGDGEEGVGAHGFGGGDGGGGVVAMLVDGHGGVVGAGAGHLEVDVHVGGFVLHGL
jgi:hypothetical protein